VSDSRDGPYPKSVCRGEKQTESQIRTETTEDLMKLNSSRISHRQLDPRLVNAQTGQCGYPEKHSRQTDIIYLHDPSFLQTAKGVHGTGCLGGQTRR